MASSIDRVRSVVGDDAVAVGIIVGVVSSSWQLLLLLLLLSPESFTRVR